MAHYIKILNNVVTTIAVAEADYFDDFVDDSPGDWILATTENSEDGKYVAVGYTWDGTLFKPAKPYPSWTWNADTWNWIPPVQATDVNGDNSSTQTVWNETDQSWDAV
jgi:hypothetical protein